jgi:hypothetical protein
MVTLDGVRPHVRPVDGEITSDSPTVPENPSRLLVVMTDAPGLPARGVTSVGVATILKS